MSPSQVQNVGDRPIGAQEIADIIGLSDGNRLMVERAVPETYHTDRHHTSGVALCPKCLRAHDPAKIITCECGYQAPLVLRHNLADCQLSDLIKLRDRLNEIIYDKEKAPQ